MTGLQGRQFELYLSSELYQKDIQETRMISKNIILKVQAAEQNPFAETVGPSPGCTT